MKQFLIFNISLYQRLKKFFFLPSACRFTPSCSEYTKESLRRHGIITGSALGIKRILRCHPWSSGGQDPVPKRPNLFFQF